MAWTELTAAMVNAQWAAEEAAALGALNGGDKVPEVLGKVISQVREDILAGGFQLSSDATLIPTGLHNDAIALVRWKVLASFPGMESLQTDARKLDYKDALTKLRDIATGRRKVEPPEGSLGFVSAGRWNSENKFTGRMHSTPRPGPNNDDAYSNPDGPGDES